MGGGRDDRGHMPGSPQARTRCGGVLCIGGAGCRLAWRLLRKAAWPSGGVKTMPWCRGTSWGAIASRRSCCRRVWMSGCRQDHFARFVIAAVEAMDLSAFYADYRADGHGRPAHDPAMMVALLVYAYARGQRSSRVIERGCFEDIAFRVICGESAARSHDDRPVSPAPRARVGGAVRAGAGALRAGRAGGGRGAGGRWHEGARQRVGARDARLPAARRRGAEGGRRGRRRRGRAVRGSPRRRAAGGARERPGAQEVA